MYFLLKCSLLITDLIKGGTGLEILMNNQLLNFTKTWPAVLKLFYEYKLKDRAILVQSRGIKICLKMFTLVFPHPAMSLNQGVHKFSKM
jgi:hypothetical protein